MRSSARKGSARSVDPATAWAQAAVRGDFVTGDLVRHAAERHLRDLRDAERRGYFWRPKLAQRALDFFPSVFTITDGPAAGKPFHLLPYQTFCVGSLMGWVNADGRWRFRNAFVETGKGQAKSPMMAGLGLYALGWCGFPRAQIYSIAANKQTANVLFKDAFAMCRAQIPGYDEDETLESQGHVLLRGEGDNVWKIEHPGSQSFFLPLAGGTAQSGPRPRMVLADEIHEFTTDAQIEIWRRAITKVAGSAMMVMGTNTPATSQLVGTSYSNTAIAIAKGDVKDDTQFAFVARVDKRDHDTVFTDETCWPKALPALGITYPIQNLREEVATAQTRLSTAASVKRLYFGIATGAADFWIREDKWAAVLQPVDAEIMAALKGCPCWLSLDLSQKNDLTALTCTWRDGAGVLWQKTWYWTTSEGLDDRATADQAPYQDWVEAGYLTAVDGPTIEKTFPAARVAELAAGQNVQELVFDPAQFADFLEACKLVGLPVWVYEGPDKPAGTGLKLVRHAQGTRVVFEDRQYCMPRSIERFEDRILNGTIVIDQSPVTYMCASNAAFDTDGLRNRAFNKKRSRGRIDGIVTGAMGAGAADGAELEADRYTGSYFVDLESDDSDAEEAA
ncbi:terminase large subunit [Sphingomonas endophytica]|uniref:Phage terminase large subunit-like protein n=1 Tax=Sphingomonas endophytica TaxID=869719 RepID=A0ABR6N950_9SPHN|nr:terminase TerL endonuclease subunit [Sphingomonas endophytica]MBB5727321.1 phage terminase large subunit-like protein [Sphingomonas endophytica]